MKVIVAIVFIVGSVILYVTIDNKNQKNMTFRQKFLKTFYPLIMKGSKKIILSNKDNIQPIKDLYAIKIKLSNDSIFDLSVYKGKKIMIVNVASDCGFTAQYEELEHLYETHKDSLLIIAFPANDFKQQEKGTDADIVSFCKKNYGVSFPIAQKAVVVKNKEQQELYQWLTNKNLNGWNEQAPTWNFCKYIIDEKGVLMRFANSSITPEVAFQ